MSGNAKSGRQSKIKTIPVKTDLPIYGAVKRIEQAAASIQYSEDAVARIEAACEKVLVDNAAVQRNINGLRAEVKKVTGIVVRLLSDEQVNAEAKATITDFMIQKKERGNR